jgi:hypothetical protein
MTQIVDEPVQSPSPNGDLLLLMGSVIGLASAAALAWDGTACADVVSELLSARNATGIIATAQRLVRIGCCPFGLAVGGTFVFFGLRRAACQYGLSRACAAFLAVHGLLAAVGAFSVCQGASNLHASFSVVAAHGQPLKAEEVAAATKEAAMPLSRGWMLLAVAQGALLAGGIAQIVLRPTSVSPPQGPGTAIAALILLWLFGAIVSIAWIRHGLSVQDFAASSVVKASDVAASIMRVLWSGVAGSWLLMGYALFTTIHAVIATIGGFRRSSLPAALEGH